MFCSSCGHEESTSSMPPFQCTACGRHTRARDEEHPVTKVCTECYGTLVAGVRCPWCGSSSVVGILDALPRHANDPIMMDVLAGRREGPISKHPRPEPSRPARSLTDPSVPQNALKSAGTKSTASGSVRMNPTPSPAARPVRPAHTAPSAGLRALQWLAFLLLPTLGASATMGIVLFGDALLLTRVVLPHAATLSEGSQMFTESYAGLAGVVEGTALFFLLWFLVVVSDSLLKLNVVDNPNYRLVIFPIPFAVLGTFVAAAAWAYGVQTGLASQAGTAVDTCAGVTDVVCLVKFGLSHATIFFVSFFAVFWAGFSPLRELVAGLLSP